MHFLYSIAIALSTWLFMESAYDYIKLNRKNLTKTSMYKKVHILLFSSMAISIVYFFAELYWVTSDKYQVVTTIDEFIWIVIECSMLITLGNACSLSSDALIKIEYNLAYKVVDKYISLEAEHAAERHRMDDWLYNHTQNSGNKHLIL